LLASVARNRKTLRGAFSPNPDFLVYLNVGAGQLASSSMKVAGGFDVNFVGVRPVLKFEEQRKKKKKKTFKKVSMQSRRN
jgi:small neutral amino acid transporter SnatA (MarC family)